VILASRLRVLGLVGAVGAAVIAACTTTTTTTTFTPITGIEIRSAALVAGFGCGMAPHQVFRYAATVSFAAPDGGPPPPQTVPIFTNIFDCFTDGVFENLPIADGGSLTFSIAIFAYNEDAYLNKAQLPPNLGCVPTLDGGGALNCTPATMTLSVDQRAAATWITTCTATQQAGTPVIAVCPPLSPPDAGVPEASTDAASDGAQVPADASGDAGLDATMAPEPDAASDGGMASPDGDASPADAGVADGSSSTDG
jgi:hypothetical protein